MKITLKDGSSKEYAESMRVIEAAGADMSARVWQEWRRYGEVNNCEFGILRTVVERDCELSILTFQDENGKGAFRRVLRHILLSQAMKAPASVSGCKTGDRTIRSRWILL